MRQGGGRVGRGAVGGSLDDGRTERDVAAELHRIVSGASAQPGRLPLPATASRIADRAASQRSHLRSDPGRLRHLHPAERDRRTGHHPSADRPVAAAARCGAGLFRAPRPADHPGELASHRFAHNNYILPISDITFTGPTGTVRTPPIRPVVLSNSIWMIREAALSGDCVGILPIYSIVDELRNGALVPVFDHFMVQSALLSAFYRRSPQVPAKVRMLLKYLTEQYGDQPPWEQRLVYDRPHLRRILSLAACAS